jgi:CheY-like chemotaxis protein
MKKILVVDDERDVESLFRQQFRKEIRANEVEIHFAFSAKEALDYMGKIQPFNLVLLMSDINMPEMSGLELLKKAKELYPGLQVILVTAFGDEGNMNAAKEYGADGFFTKPVNFDSLRKSMLSLEKLQQ